MKLLIDECLSTELTKRAQPTSAQCGGKHIVGQLQWFIPPRELSLELKKQEEIRTHLDHAAGSFGCIRFAYRGNAAATIGGRAVGMKHYQHWPDLRPFDYDMPPSNAQAVLRVAVPL